MLEMQEYPKNGKQPTTARDENMAKNNMSAKHNINQIFESTLADKKQDQIVQNAVKTSNHNEHVCAALEKRNESNRGIKDNIRSTVDYDTDVCD